MTTNSSRRNLALSAAMAALVLSAWKLSAQAPAPAARATTAPDAIIANSYPNPFSTVPGFFKMPAGRKWGSTAGVDIDKDGKTVWIIDRCGGNSCYDSAAGKMSDLDPVLHFDENGKLIKSFGAGMIVFPHGIGVDPDGNVWITDGNDNRPSQGRGAAGAGRGSAIGAAAGATKGHQVFKFSPDGKLLLTLGKSGGAAEVLHCRSGSAASGNQFRRGRCGRCEGQHLRRRSRADGREEIPPAIADHVRVLARVAFEES